MNEMRREEVEKKLRRRGSRNVRGRMGNGNYIVIEVR